MIDIFVRSFIGDFGGKLLDFYLEYSLVINGIILLYFLFVVLGRRNYRFILNSVFKFLKNNHSRLFTKKNPDNLVRLLKGIDIPWLEILDTSKFPILTPPGSFRLYIKNNKNIKKLYSEEVLAKVIIEAVE
jgi:hypothetical protein